MPDLTDVSPEGMLKTDSDPEVIFNSQVTTYQDPVLSIEGVNAQISHLTFVSSDTSVATVNAVGQISAVTSAIDGDNTSIAYIYTFNDIDESWHRTKVIVA